MAYFTTNDGCRLYYELHAASAGKRVITFINGTLQTTINWKSITRNFQHAYSVLLYDSRGQGASEQGQLPLTLKQHVDDLTALLYTLNIAQSHIVGVSHGARIALDLAARRPERVLRMVLCGISTQSPFRARVIFRSWQEIIRRHSLDAMVWAAMPYVFGRTYLRDNEKMLERIVKTIVRRNQTGSLRAHLDALVHYPPLAASLKPAPHPVLVLTGEDDPLVTAEGAEEIARVCGGRHQQLPGVGHSLSAEAPELLTRLITQFLQTA